MVCDGSIEPSFQLVYARLTDARLHSPFLLGFPSFLPTHHHHRQHLAAGRPGRLRPSLIAYMSFIIVLLTICALFAVPCLFIPRTIWNAFTAGDDLFDERGYEMNLVAASKSYADCLVYLVFDKALEGNPFREDAPPVCMAKLIMLRHKVSPRLLTHSLAIY